MRGTQGQWFDPSAFSLPPAGQLGNVGRNTLVGPNVRSLNFSVLRDFPISRISEAFRIQFRAEFFNILNRVNLGNPQTGIFVQGGANNPNAGQITTLSTPMRQIQFALKVLF